MLLSAPVQAGWRIGNEVWVQDGNSSQPTVIFVSSPAKLGPPPDEWFVYDVTDWGIPSDALAIMLTGILITTHGKAIETCNLTVTFRSFGDTLNH